MAIHPSAGLGENLNLRIPQEDLFQGTSQSLRRCDLSRGATNLKPRIRVQIHEMIKELLRLFLSAL
jgi:hypothetical protein